MDLMLTDEQRLLESSALAMLAREYDAAARRASLGHPERCSPALWRRFAELGWLALPLPESAGGLGGRELDVGLLMQALGRHRVIEPYEPCLLQAGRLLAALGGAEAQRLLTGIAEGRQRWALAHAELAAADPYAVPRCRAERTPHGWRLNGYKPLVRGAPGAAGLLVSAIDERGRTAVFSLASEAAGLTLHPVGLADDCMAADVRMADAPAQRLGDAGADALPALVGVIARAAVATCWEAHGVMRSAFERTVAHTAQREQFGQPLARFQVVQHRLAEMKVACEEARAACLLASLRLDRDATQPDGGVALAALAKSKVGRAARFVSQEAVQLHGAMGVCEELPIAASFRKLTVFGQRLGATAWHSAQLAQRHLAGHGWRHSQTLPEPAGSAT